MNNTDSRLKIGIIMDGNGRWAVEKKRPRTFGHNEGLKSAKTIVKAASKLNISHVTLYAFSTENWKRAEEEVSFLMQLIKKHLVKEMNFYKENKIKVKVVGNTDGLPDYVSKEIAKVEEETSHFTGLTVCLAINYGGRDELIRTVNKLIKENPGREITEELISASLDCPEIAETDLIIRTASEQRLSNFLLWESAYSEFYYSDKLWPDFTPEDLNEALDWYNSRNRKFGGVK